MTHRIFNDAILTSLVIDSIELDENAMMNG
jgi:hypothetical protein